ncbi:hypothetical protein GIB67_004633 [Kingdonia uniflora]|uniref:Zinc-ribbon 15 domain-containing protein n=1 Tax=Kingdonia uniflora TaxID=39325 RepID=A0A7J7MDG2_9MAGN|nr:hypothetical protein GIB67_004633 [Kingdonia uniflora]
MFFFFVGGISPQVRQVLKPDAARCIRCGSLADLVEEEKVLKLFFVPVWRWLGKEPVIYCNNCSTFFPPSTSLPPPPSHMPSPPDGLRCHSCARVVDPQFSFCPYCGYSL